MKPTITILTIGLLASTLHAQSSAEWRVYVSKCEAAKEQAQKNLDASIQRLTMTKASLETARANTRHEDIMEYRDVAETITYANGRKQEKIVHKLVKVGQRDIPDPSIPQLVSDVAFYQSQVDSGRSQMGVYDPKIAEGKQKLSEALAREQAMTKPEPVVQKQVAPATVAPAPEPDHEQPLAQQVHPRIETPWYFSVEGMLAIGGGGVVALLVGIHLLGRMMN